MDALETVLARINDLVSSNDTLLSLWAELGDTYQRSYSTAYDHLSAASASALRNQAFYDWAVQHVDPEGLHRIATALYGDEIELLRADNNIRWRIRTAAASFQTVPAVLRLVFGHSIVASRSAITALRRCSTKCPTLGLAELSHCYLQQRCRDLISAHRTKKKPVDERTSLRTTIRALVPNVHSSSRVRRDSPEPSSAVPSLDSKSGLPGRDEELVGQVDEVSTENEEEAARGVEEFTAASWCPVNGSSALHPIIEGIEADTSRHDMAQPRHPGHSTAPETPPSISSPAGDDDAAVPGVSHLDGHDTDDQESDRCEPSPDVSHHQDPGGSPPGSMPNGPHFSGSVGGETELEEQPSFFLDPSQIQAAGKSIASRTSPSPSPSPHGGKSVCQGPEDPSMADELTTLSAAPETPTPRQWPRAQEVAATPDGHASFRLQEHVTTRKRRRPLATTIPLEDEFPREIKRPATEQLDRPECSTRPAIEIQQRKRPPTLNISLENLTHSLHTLDSGQWLNDIILNTLMRHITASVPDVATVDTLVLMSYNKLSPRTSEHHRTSLSNSNAVLIPACESSTHWRLYRWLPHSKTLELYDPLPGSSCRDTTTGLVLGFLSGIFGDDLSPVGILGAVRVQCPQQPNGFDCGIFVLEIAAHLARGLALPRAFASSQALRQYYRDVLLSSLYAAMPPELLVQVERLTSNTTFLGQDGLHNNPSDADQHWRHPLPRHITRTYIIRQRLLWSLQGMADTPLAQLSGPLGDCDFLKSGAARERGGMALVVAAAGLRMLHTMHERELQAALRAHRSVDLRLQRYEALQELVRVQESIDDEETKRRRRGPPSGVMATMEVAARTALAEAKCWRDNRSGEDGGEAQERRQVGYQYRRCVALVLIMRTAAVRLEFFGRLEGIRPG